MKSMIKELWHGNIIPQEDSRNNSKEMKELLGYMARHHKDLEKIFTDEQKEIFEKFHECWSEYASISEAAIFAYTFKLGMRIAVDGLGVAQILMRSKNSQIMHRCNSRCFFDDKLS